MPHSSRDSYLQTPVVTVLVGDAKAKFSIHQGLLCARSPFFAKTLNDDGAESHERLVPVPDDDPYTFRLYQELLYAHVLPIKQEPTPSSKGFADKEAAAVAVGPEFTILSRLYLLAKKLQDEKTKTEVLLAFHERASQPGADGCVHCPGVDYVQLIYGGTCAGSRTRERLAACYTEHADGSFLSAHDADVDEVPKDFLYDPVASVLEKRLRKKDVETQLRRAKVEITGLVEIKINSKSKKHKAMRGL